MLRDDNTDIPRSWTLSNPSTSGKIAVTARPRLMKFMPIDENTYGNLGSVSRKHDESERSAPLISRMERRHGSREIPDSLPRSKATDRLLSRCDRRFVTSPRGSRHNNADVQARLARHSLRHPMGKRGAIEATASKRRENDSRIDR